MFTGTGVTVAPPPTHPLRPLIPLRKSTMWLKMLTGRTPESTVLEHPRLQALGSLLLRTMRRPFRTVLSLRASGRTRALSLGLLSAAMNRAAFSVRTAAVVTPWAQ